jgi:hypothetical protein
MVERILSWGPPQTLVVGHPQASGADYGHPVYYAGPLDPVYTVRCTRWRSRCEVDGMRVQIPRLARPAGGSDRHMAIVDQLGRWEYDLWQVQRGPLPAPGGTLRVSHGGRTRWGTAGSDGLGSAATAAHFALAAGMIRAEEWDAAVRSGGAINHALFIGLRCTSASSVYPAQSGARATLCAARERTQAPPLGARLRLDMSEAEIRALAVPPWERPILRAMARYGMIVGDTFGGEGRSFGLWVESDVQYTALGFPGRYAELGRRWGAPAYRGAYLFEIGSGVDWARRLRVVAPCASRGSC